MTLLRKGQPWYAPYSLAGSVLAPSYLADFENGLYAVSGQRTVQSEAVVATVGSITISGGALQCPGDGSAVYNTVGLALPAAGTVLVSATVDATGGIQRLMGGAAAAQSLLYILSIGTVASFSGASALLSDVTLSAPQSFVAAMSWSGTDWTICVDGSVNAGTYTAGFYTGISPLGIGSESDGGAPFTGSIPRAVIYDKALTAAQLQELTGGV